MNSLSLNVTGALVAVILEVLCEQREREKQSHMASAAIVQYTPKGSDLDASPSGTEQVWYIFDGMLLNITGVRFSKMCYKSQKRYDILF